MSWQLTEKILASKLEPSLKLVAVVLSTYGSADGRNVRPTVGKVAEKASLSDSQVRRTLAKLRRLGVLVVESKMVPGPNGLQPAGGRPQKDRGQATHYRFDLNKLKALPKTVAPTRGFCRPARPVENPQNHRTDARVSEQPVAAPNPETLAPMREKPSRPCAENPRTHARRSVSGSVSDPKDQDLPPPKARRETRQEGPALLSPPEFDWFEECQRLHGRRCNGQYGHAIQMANDAERAKNAADREERRDVHA